MKRSLYAIVVIVVLCGAGSVYANCGPDDFSYSCGEDCTFSYGCVYQTGPGGHTADTTLCMQFVDGGCASIENNCHCGGTSGGGF
jgi:hypothetical protein